MSRGVTSSAASSHSLSLPSILRLCVHNIPQVSESLPSAGCTATVTAGSAGSPNSNDGPPSSSPIDQQLHEAPRGMYCSAAIAMLGKVLLKGSDTCLGNSLGVLEVEGAARA